MRVVQVFLATALLSLSTFNQVAQAKSRAPPPSGKWTVIDASTGKPIPSAWVTIEWLEGHDGLVHPSESCERLDVLMSGPDGTFEIPKAPKKGEGAPMPAKVGYMSAPNRATQNYERREVYLVPFSGSRREALSNAGREVGQGKCVDDASIRNLLPKRKEFLEERLRLTDPEDRKLVREAGWIKEIVDEDERRVNRK